MPDIPPLPGLPPPEARPPWVDALLSVIAALRQENHRLQEENQALRDKVARLKGQKGKPAIAPSRLNEKKGRKGKGQRKGDGLERRIDRTVVVKAEGVPEGRGPRAAGM